MDRMQKFVSIARALPRKRSAAERIRDHKEILPDFTADAAREQASRCEQCGIPYCQSFCPLHNNIPDWLKLTAEGRLEDAYHLAQQTNNFPEICGRICPQEKLCEAKWACTLEQAGHDAVAIGAVERHIAETAWENGWVRPRRALRQTGRRVAIIGAGPAGMAAAEELCAKGHAVHLFDRHARMGGLMSYGIPEFKMEQIVVERRARLLLDAGVTFHGGETLGETIALEQLRADFDAVILAYGAQQSRHLGLPGEDLGGVVPALDYLVSSSRAEIGEIPAPTIDAADKWVVVIGGGDTAMDCVRTAVRQGAAGVTCLYRRDRDNMPGSTQEVHHATEEGGQFEWLSQPESLSDVPVDFVSSEVTALEHRGGVRAVQALRTRLARTDTDARLRPQVVAGSGFHVAADLVVNALGFEVADTAPLSAGRITLNRDGRITADPDSRMTAWAGVFAAGDARIGPSLAVWAIREGREVAAAVHSYLEMAKQEKEQA